MTDIFDHPWLGALFGDDDIAALWSVDAQLDHYRRFEAALALALEASDRVRPGHGTAAAQTIMDTDIDLSALAQGTAQDGLPVPALVRQLRAAAGADAVAVHHGATSQDVLDTALALTLHKVTSVLIERLITLEQSLSALDKTFGAKQMMGRTRMQAALPITVSDRLQSWRRPIVGHIDALRDLVPRVARLQLGGAVGTRHGFGDAADKIADLMADNLGLSAGPVWHSDRTALVEYGGRLSLITGSLGKLGQDIALMAQQGVDNVAITGGGGSSAMPHKSNPILAELLVTLARFNAAQVSGLHQTLIHEQERSGVAWMLEWMILPPMAQTTGRALTAAGTLLGSITRLGEAD